ncbi:hypothetical protein O3P69_010060 [Scylla paramamosain]|uniref:Uncharacterized protein n=1 Tax=Scylla paramamosain TaxID=85552 RepID=A0AAW0SPG4_SCYPA
MMGTNRKRRSLEEMETTRQRSMPNLRQGREDTRAWMSREPKMRRERNEESGVNGDEERREKNPLGRGVNAQGVKKLQERHENRTSSREKRNAIWSFLFGDEEEEEDEEEEMEVVTSGNRAIPFPASPKSEAVDYKTFIKASLFPVYFFVFCTTDEVQDEDVVGGNGGLNDLGLIKNIRSKCSTYFLYFLIQEKERNFVEDDEDTYVDLKTVGSDCPQDDYRETITFNPICNLEVVCDNYGCFDYFLRELCMEMVQYSYLKGKLTCPCPPACKYHSNGQLILHMVIVAPFPSLSPHSNSNNSDPVRLHFYMDSLSYEKIEESPAFTWNTLVCNVGGNLGLFLGMSIVTLVELLEFLIDLLFSCCNFRKSDATRGGGGGGRGSSPVIGQDGFY